MLHSSSLPKILSGPGINLNNNFIQTINFQEPLPAWCFSTDTRNIAIGGWFIALKGKNHDAHSFLEQAIGAGANGLIVSDLQKVPIGKVPTILVNDTLEAYQQIARIQRCALNPITIALTGSNGKTTTKEILAAVLAEKYKTYATQANENNQIGLPKTILAAPSDTQALVLEMGMRGLGQIAELACTAEPDYAIITNIGTAHIGLLGSRQKIAQAKAEIFCQLPTPKIVYVPAHEALLKPWLDKVKDKTQVRTFGNYVPIGFEDDTLGFIYKDAKFRLKTPNLALIGNACAVIELAHDLGLTDEQIQDGFECFVPGAGRGRVLSLASGATVIDETYNASPDSVIALAKSLNALGNQKKILVLGEIAEMGDFAGDLLKNLAAQLTGLVDEVVLVGEGNLELKECLPKSILFSLLEDACQYLKQNANSYLGTNCLLGLKASRVSKLERLIGWLEDA
jgi:UDP-N-acetylmuramoyl-tripeptide--D-alanyl-D-alanine ligase